MDAKGRETGELQEAVPSGVNGMKHSTSDAARREKNRFWIERPERRFVVYFCVLVAAEVLVVMTLHSVFHFF